MCGIGSDTTKHCPDEPVGIVVRKNDRDNSSIYLIHSGLEKAPRIIPPDTFK